MTGSFCASRRAFLAALLALPTLPAMLLASIELRVGLIDDGTAEDAVRGAKLSASEAARAAALLGSSIELAANDTSANVLVLACARSSVERVIADVGDRSVVMINAALPVAALAAGDARLVHLASDAAEYSRLWAPDLERFGAGQLNARYQHAYRTPMSAQAWAGWFAVKVLWEAAARTRSTRPEDVARYLATGAFDGHKGAPLRLNESTRVLQ